MDNLTRVTGKIFASNADADDIGQYGSALAGTRLTTDDVATIQALPAYEEGWRGAVISNKNYPTLQEMNGLQKTFSYQINYLLQKGVAKWDSATEYYTNDFCGVGNELYVSIADNNINHDPTELNSAYWALYSPGLGTYANQDLTNLSSTGENHFANSTVNNSKGLLTGAVCDNSIIYADVLNYAYSTFNGSYFSTTGNPIITDNGIVSNISSSNYVYITNQIYLNRNNFELGVEANITSLSATQRIFQYRDAFIVQVQTNGKVRLYVSSDGNNWDIANAVDSTNALSLGKHKIKAVFTGAQYIVYVDNTAWITVDSTTQTASQTDLYIFSGCASQPMAGSQDLKTFYFKINGELIRSGVKTGIDTIKPNDYTVVGTPTISADGIASGFSNTNYITVPFTYSDNTVNYVEKIAFTTGSDITNRQPLRGIGANENKGIGITIQNSKLNYRIGTGSTWNTNNSIEISANTAYIVEFMQTSTQSIFKLYSRDNVLLDTKEVTYTSLLYSSIILGQNKIWGNDSTTALIDLNGYEIYVNGNLIYQPCLYIPYAQSKTGSKVVDVAYRHRVQDMYEQFGYAPYYTIDEVNQNFTLPMGEVYGMITEATDGEWVYVDDTDNYNTISTATAIASSNITSTVRSKLPSDSNYYTYECLFYYVIKRNSGDESSVYSILVDNKKIVTDLIDGSASTTVYGGQFLAILKKSSSIIEDIATKALAEHNLYLVAYRKLAK